MPVWPYRYQLSLQDRVRRSVYELLRDQMDMYLIKQALIVSYKNFSRAGEPYPFVSKRELKPRARVVEKEYILHNRFLLLFCEGTIPSSHKKYIRFFDTNKVTKETITEPSVIFKPADPKQSVVPWDVTEALQLWRKREPQEGKPLTDVFTEISEVTEAPLDIVGRAWRSLSRRSAPSPPGIDRDPALALSSIHNLQ